MLATICTVAESAGFPPHSEAQSKKVVVQLVWVVGGLHAEFFVGYMEEDRIVFQIKLMSDLMKISPPRDVYTNQFINKKSVTAPPALAAELSKCSRMTTTVVVLGIWIRVQSSATLNPANKLANRAGMFASMTVE